MIYDLIIVGGGPAGLTAALYARRAEKTVLVLEKETFGGQITYSPKVENIPGFISLSGNEFAEKLVEQVLNQGAEVDSCTVTGIQNGKIKTVHTDCGDFEAKAVILATGAKHRLPGVPGEEAYLGNGISFCAVCDGAFYKNQTVAVIGGGNSALQEALLLSDLAKKVYVVQNLSDLTGEARLAAEVRARDNITVICDTVADAFLGEDTLTGIRLKRADGTVTELTVDGVFVAIGLLPQNEPFADLIALNDYGYASSDESCITKTEGIFVAGDCRSKRIRQVTTAVADGAIAALKACEYVKQIES